MVFAYVPIERWIIHPCVYCLLDSSDDVLILPPHNTEIINGGTMTCDVVMVTYWGGSLQVFLNLSPNVLDDFPMYSSSHSTLLHLNL